MAGAWAKRKRVMSLANEKSILRLISHSRYAHNLISRSIVKFLEARLVIIIKYFTLLRALHNVIARRRINSNYGSAIELPSYIDDRN